MSYSLDTDSFINAFTRMTSRRGTPIYVISENESNFVGQCMNCGSWWRPFTQERIPEETTKYHCIDWKFNPPSAPHFGGIHVYQAMIKSAKKEIKAILGDANINDEELHTAICGAERLSNSQPITYFSADPHDLSPLSQATSSSERWEDHLPLKHLIGNKITTQEMVAPRAATPRTDL